MFHIAIDDRNSSVEMATNNPENLPENDVDTIIIKNNASSSCSQSTNPRVDSDAQKIQNSTYGYDQPPDHPLGTTDITRRYHRQKEPHEDVLCCSILNCMFCCWIFGLIAIVYSHKARSATTKGREI